MKRAIQIEQILKFNHTIIVETDDEDVLYMQAQTAESVCDELSNMDDYLHELRKQGVKVSKIIEDGSPENEIEFVDIYTPDEND